MACIARGLRRTVCPLQRQTAAARTLPAFGKQSTGALATAAPLLGRCVAACSARRKRLGLGLGLVAITHQPQPAHAAERARAHAFAQRAGAPVLTGFGQVHASEQAHLIGQALDINFKGLHTL